jgi:rSAM/selenodomain-associated transferase 2
LPCAQVSRPVPLPAVTVVIPTLNAAPTLAVTLASLVVPDGQIQAEILVVDGGSNDATCVIAESAGARVITAARGRGIQLAAGVAAVRSPWLLLLHADTRLDPSWQDAVRRHTADAGRAGYFRFALDSADPRSRSLERAVGWRCSTLALPYGDQGLLIHRDLLTKIGGIRPLPLMEDVDLVRRLGRRRLVPLEARAITSARRWEHDGWRRRSLRNLLCLGLFFAGVPPRWICLLYT